MNTRISADDYKRLLLKWIKGAKEHLYQLPGQTGLLCYGPGSNGWGVQTNQKAFAAFAIASAAADFDEHVTGMTREACREAALAMLRFSLRSHIGGDMHCTDGTKWGNTWISVLGIERMMHGVEALTPYFSEQDHVLLRQVLLSESDYLLHQYNIVADVDGRSGKNKPESNMWNGALMHRTALMYPDAPNAADYRKKGTQFLMNAVSTLQDLEDDQTFYDGLKLKEHLVGANFFDTYALHHHGYLNVGYMVICLSNAAMLHFMYKKNKAKAPEALYHHIKQLWQLVKSLTFPDGRLMRIGGDTRVRYTYCQEYLVPTWLMVRDLYGEDDDVRNMESGWLKQVEQEMAWNGDHTYLSTRLAGLAKRSPLYYTRLESDRAVCMSMGAAWSGLAAANSTAVIRPLTTWQDAFHGAYFHRSSSRAASWVWEAAEKPQGLCVPLDGSNMAEWRENLSGHLSGLGRMNGQRLCSHNGALFEGGFITWGETIACTELTLAEGVSDEDLARNQIVCAALPDDTHMIVLQRMVALDRRIYINQLNGLNLNIPNDLFNGNERQYYSDEGLQTLQGVGSEQTILQLSSHWINVDDRLGIINIYGADQMSIRRPGQRNIGLAASPKNGEGEDSLYADQVCGPYLDGVRSIDANEVLLDTGYLMQSGQSHAHTKAYAKDGKLVSKLTIPLPEVRGVQVKGGCGKMFILLANFGERPAGVIFSASSEPVDVVTTEPATPIHGDQWKVNIKAGAGKLLCLKDR